MRVLNQKGKLHIAERVLAVVMAAVFTVSLAAPASVSAAVPSKKKLTLEACRNFAIQNSTDYESAEITVESKKAAYESAVKALALKEKNMKTFRWNFLLSFHFPEDPNFVEASEFQYKPMSLMYEVREAEHKLSDKTFEINEKVNTLYTEIVVLQETIAFNEKRLEATKEGLSRNQAKLRLGEATQADVDKLDKKVESLTNKISSDRTNLEANLKKLTNMVGFDVSTGYTFEKPFIEATIERSMLNDLIVYTEDRDDGYYDACTEEVSKRAELTINARLMQNYYGGDYNMIRSYVNTALQGGRVNKKAFSKDYKAFLKKIDSYWEGYYKIYLLFFTIKFPKLWTKGDMDGTRYIEDDPSVLQQNVLDYSQALNDKLAAQQELDQSVTDAFNNYISVRNSYKQYIKDTDNAEAELQKSALRNRMGLMTFDEYDSEMESYEELQNSMLSAMKLYTTTLYNFDRLTVGGVSALLKGTDADMHTAVVGESYVVEDSSEAHYTLRPIIQKQEFELALQIPDDFDIEITDYELWVNNQIVGSRTAVDKKLRHLMLAFDAVEECKVRLYNGEEFVDDSEIDPSVESGPLKIRTGYEIKREEPDQIGTYEITQNETTGLVELKFTMNNEGSECKKFKVKNLEGKTLGKDEMTEIDKGLVYIELLMGSVDDLTVEFYGDDDSLVESARLDSANSAVLRKEEE